MERTNRLAVKLNNSLRQLIPRIGISPATFWAARSENATISGKTWGKLERAEIAAGLLPPVGSVEETEQRATYRHSGSLEPLRRAPERSISEEMLDPRFQPRGRPSTRQDVEVYFHTYCERAAAANDPDLFPAIMRQLKLHFRFEELDVRKNAPP